MLVLLAMLLAAGGTQPAATPAPVKVTNTVTVTCTNCAGGEGGGGGLTNTELRADPVEVDGSGVTQPVSAAALPLPAGAATEATLAGIKTGTDKIPAAPAATADVQAVRDRLPAALDASGGVKVHEQGTVSVTGPVTDGQLRATPVPISGTVTANLGTLNGAATAAKQPALGTAGSPSTDILTVQGHASGTPLPVSGIVTVGTHAVTQSGTWTVQPGNTANTTAWKVDGSAVTQPVSGTVTATPVLATSANNTGACVNVTTGSTTVAASFATRKFVSITNKGSATVYLKLGGTATASNYPLAANENFTLEGSSIYSGVIDGLSSSGTQSVCLVEF